ncbi:hypothetical protein PYW08_016944 [Mythimna loreyi]|nr:hypothetical protein PYW08_016944 [Mythimna loreyi]
MPLAHTPRKQAVPETNSPVDREKAGPSPKTTPTPSVRKSIGEWENSKSRDPRAAVSTTFTMSPKKQAQLPPALPRTALKVTLPQTAKESKRRSLTETTGGSQKTIAVADRVTEGRTWLQRAKTQLGESRNLKSEIKVGITLAVDSMYKLIKEAAVEIETLRQKSGQSEVRDPVSPLSVNALSEDTGDTTTALLISKIEAHSKLLQENNKSMEDLKLALEEQK